MKWMTDICYLRCKLKEIIDAWNDSPESNGVEDRDVKEIYSDLKDILNDCKSLKLYKYVPATYYSIRNIEKSIIHFSHVGNFNDVFEGIAQCDYDSLSPKQKRILGQMCNATCFSESHNNLLM